MTTIFEARNSDGLPEIMLMPDDPSTSGLPAWCSFPVSIDDRDAPSTLLSRIPSMNKGAAVALRCKLPPTGFTLLSDLGTLIAFHLKDYEHVRWGKQRFDGGVLDGTEEAFTYPAKGSPAFHEWMNLRRTERSWTKNKVGLYFLYETKKPVVVTSDPLILEFTLTGETIDPPDWVLAAENRAVVHGYH